MNNLNSKLVGMVVIGVIVVLGLGIAAYLYSQNQQKTNIQTAPKTAQGSQQEVKALVAEVGKLMELPTNEDPTVATITDITKLQNQPFFKKGRNGDKVLIYANARKAILYDPDTKKVIDVAPINFSSPSAQVASPKPSSSTLPTQSPVQ